MRGISAVGSAPHWQCGGQGFESPILHHGRGEQPLLFIITAGFEPERAKRSGGPFWVEASVPRPADLPLGQRCEIPYTPPKKAVDFDRKSAAFFLRTLEFASL